MSALLARSCAPVCFACAWVSTRIDFACAPIFTTAPMMLTPAVTMEAAKAKAAWERISSATCCSPAMLASRAAARSSFAALRCSIFASNITLAMPCRLTGFRLRLCSVTATSS